MAYRIRVTVKPQAKKEEVKQIAEGEYIAFVHAPARDGKANQTLIEMLAGYFSVRQSSVRILHGQTSRRKLVEIG